MVALSGFARLRLELAHVADFAMSAHMIAGLGNFDDQVDASEMSRGSSTRPSSSTYRHLLTHNLRVTQLPVETNGSRVNPERRLLWLTSEL